MISANSFDLAKIKSANEAKDLSQRSSFSAQPLCQGRLRRVAQDQPSPRASRIRRGQQENPASSPFTGRGRWVQMNVRLGNVTDELYSFAL